VVTRGARAAGITLVVLAVGAALTLAGMQAVAAAQQAAIVRAMPAGWVDIFRARTTVPPSVVALAAPRTDSCDAASLLDDAPRGLWAVMSLDSAYRRARVDSTTARDTLIWDQLEHDPALEAWGAGARCRRWDGLRAVGARTDTAARDDLLTLRGADYAAVIRALEALALRGWVRTDRGAVASARQDLAAVVGIGELLLRHEPTLNGFLAGRNAVHIGALGLDHLAARTGDTALARLADEAAQWSTPSTARSYAILAAAPDSALVFARDTALALGWRVEALRATIEGPMQLPARRWFGLPRTTHLSLSDLGRGAEGAFGILVMLAESAAVHVDAMTPWARWSRFSGRGGMF
jgi:hypothetical protein